MYLRQELRWGPAASLQNCYLVLVSFHSQPGISFPAIRVDHAAGLNCLLHKTLQTGCRGIGNVAQPDATDTALILLASDDYQSLSFRLPPANVFFQPAYVGLVHFHSAAESVTVWPYHRSAQFMQPKPGRAVAAQSQDSLHAHGTGPILLRGHPPDGPEPQRQRLPRILKNRARGHRPLVLAFRAHQQVPPG